jgi:RND family efflux transporter MFP subunit
MKKSITLLALIAIVASLGACSGEKKEAANKTEVKPIVKLAAVTARPVEQIQEFTANVKADVTNKIAPSTPVRIREILVEVGDHVIKGQKVVTMDDSNLKQVKANLDNLEIEFKRNDELYKVGGVSKSAWDNAKTNLDMQRAAYDNLVENTALLSPITGVITARNYDNGDLYNGQKEVLVVEQLAPVKLMVNVSEQHFTHVKVGMPVDIKVDVYGDEQFEGKVSIVYPTVDEKTRTFPMEIKLTNQDRRVRPGMFARATVNFGTEEHVVVPDLAVIKQVGAGDRYVYVYKDGKVSYNKVLLGQRLGAEYELISGVPDNSQVVVAGQARLLDGMEVDVEK